MAAEVALACVKIFGDNRLAFGEQFVVYDLVRACSHFLLTFKPDWMPGPGNHVALHREQSFCRAHGDMTSQQISVTAMGDEHLGFKISVLMKRWTLPPGRFERLGALPRHGRH